MKKMKGKLPQKILNREGIIESLLTVILIILTVFMLGSVKNIQGTARVINYTGIVRGATQRLVKLELAGQPNDELIAYLNEILDGLENGGGTYKLTELDSVKYQKKLQAVIHYWNDLQEEILAVREDKSERAKLLEMSETYFQLANDLVGSAEEFSQKKATGIGHLEVCIIIDIVLILFLLIRHILNSIMLNKTNGELSKTAYIDIHTGLPNKSKCELVLSQRENITVPTCCMMFDLNGLKKVNDTLGHIAGDSLILNFAHVLRCAIPEKYFLGRYGGDEFVAVIVDTSKEEIELLIHNIQEEISCFNENSNQVPISFACGYALSTDFEECTLQVLLGKADHNMYTNKREMKKNLCS